MERGLGQGRPGGTSDLPRHHGDCLLEDVVLRRRRARGAPPLAPRHEGALHGRAEGNGCEPRRLQIEERPLARGHAARPAGRDGGGGVGSAAGWSQREAGGGASASNAPSVDAESEDAVIVPPAAWRCFRTHLGTNY